MTCTCTCACARYLQSQTAAVEVLQWCPSCAPPRRRAASGPWKDTTRFAARKEFELLKLLLDPDGWEGLGDG
eukprot:1487681-Prymnesium_polylepis.3